MAWTGCGPVGRARALYQRSVFPTLYGGYVGIHEYNGNSFAIVDVGEAQ